MWYPYLLTIALPILLGALIGYITNAIAIRMLFRPLTEYRIGPFRVPFTPGVIPRQRSQLSRSIARMVSKELLTEGALRRRLEDPGFQDRVYDRLSDVSDRILDTPIRTLMDAIPPPIREMGVSILGTAVKESFQEGSSPSPFRALLEEVLEQFWELPVPPSVPEGILRWVDESEGVQRFLRQAGQLFRDRVRAGLTPRQILGEEFGAERIRSLLDPLYSAVGNWVVRFLRSPEVKRDLEIHGRFLLREILAELSFFQRLLITAGQYDRTLEERMPFIVEDVIRAIERAKDGGPLKEKVLTKVTEEVEKLMDEPLGEWVEPLWALLEKGVRNGLRGAIQRILPSQEEEGLLLGIWISRLSGVSRQDLTGRTLELIHAWVYQRPVEDGIRMFIRNMWEVPGKVLGEKTIGELIPQAREEKKNLNLFLIRTIFDILSEKLPVILSALDVEDLVARRIDELDIEEVEGLLLSIISRHLRWINVFGGILGALIGTVQVLIHYIM
ncbi:MAG: DUF445 family protein [Spirochaetales bacterium]